MISDSSNDTDQGDKKSDAARQVMCQSGNNERGTPVQFIRTLMAAVGGMFDLDAATHPDTEPFPIGKTGLTKSDNGLQADWFGDVWLNPPYDNLEDWLKKALSESKREEVNRIISLVPGNTSTQWFQQYAAKADYMCCVEGRLKFLGDGSDSSAPFASVLLLFGEPTEDILRAFDELGAVYTRQELESATAQSTLNDLWESDGGAVATAPGDVTGPDPAPAKTAGPMVRDLTRTAMPAALLDFNTIGVGDRFHLEFDTGLMGTPDDIPVEGSFKVLAGGPANDGETQTPEDYHSLLCIHDETETYVCLYQNPENCIDIAASVAPDGDAWQNVRLDTVHRLETHPGPAAASYHGTTYVNDGAPVGD
jgi:hypothetical protein